MCQIVTRGHEVQEKVDDVEGDIKSMTMKVIRMRLSYYDKFTFMITTIFSQNDGPTLSRGASPMVTQPARSGKQRSIRVG